MYCSNCNTTYSTESLFCPLCGQRMSVSPCAPTLHNGSGQALSSAAPFIYSKSEQAFDASAPLEAASLQELYASDLSPFESSITSTPARVTTSGSAATFTPTSTSSAACTRAATPSASASAVSEQAFVPPGIDAYTAQSNQRTNALYLKQALDTLYEPPSTAQTGILPGDISSATVQNNRVTSVSNAPPCPEGNAGNVLTRLMHTLSKKAPPPAETNTVNATETSRSALRSLQAIVVSVALCWPLGLYKLWRSKTPFTTRMKALTSVCFLVQSTLAITLLAVCSPYVLEQQPFAFVRAYALEKLNVAQHTNGAQHAHDRGKNGGATSANGNNYSKARLPDSAAGSNANAILGANKGSTSANAANSINGNNSASGIGGINGTGGSGFGQSQGRAQANNGASAQNMAHRSASTLRTNADDDTLRFDDQGILRLASFARVKQSNIYPALTRAGFSYQPKLGSWCNAAENCALTIRTPDGHVIDAETLQRFGSIPCEKAYVYLECKTPFESLDAFGTRMTSEYEGVASTYDNGTTHSYRIDTNTDLSAFMTLTKKGDKYCGMLTWIKAPPL